MMETIELAGRVFQVPKYLRTLAPAPAAGVQVSIVAEAVGVLVDLMRHSSVDEIRMRAAAHILRIGGR